MEEDTIDTYHNEPTPKTNKSKAPRTKAGENLPDNATVDNLLEMNTKLKDVLIDLVEGVE